MDTIFTPVFLGTFALVVWVFYGTSFYMRVSHAISHYYAQTGELYQPKPTLFLIAGPLIWLVIGINMAYTAVHGNKLPSFPEEKD